MLNFPLWKVGLILVVLLWGLVLREPALSAEFTKVADNSDFGELLPNHVEGPSVSTQTKVNIVNFKQTATYIRELTYTLYPRRTGRFTIGPARLELGGAAHETKQIVVEIVRGTTRPGTRSPGETARKGRVLRRT